MAIYHQRFGLSQSYPKFHDIIVNANFIAEFVFDKQLASTTTIIFVRST